jgi:putative nucleotidyltransferase with HDIG domain
MFQIRPVPAHTDRVTGLPSWPDVLTWLEDRGTPDEAAWACALEIDGLDQITSDFGAAMGDELLRALVAVARDEAGSDAMVGRLGGNDLLVVGTGDAAGAWLAAERVLERFNIVDEGADLAPARVSAGVSAEPGATLSDLALQAEHALAFAIDRGGARVCTYDMTLLERVCEAVALEPGSSVESRRRRLLALLAPRLGPAQREHTTVHCEHVQRWAVLIARQLGARPAETARVGLAALLHDLGKTAIPEAILAKPAALSEGERVIVDQHAALGAVLVQRLGASDEVAELVHHHHARFDTHGDSVPAAAHVVGVADALATMLSDRPYRAAIGRHAAAQELRRCSGAQFHPAVTAAAIDLLEDAARLAA